MANQEQLALLRQGVDTWNRWREKHPQVKVDLSGADLNGADLSRINLFGANLCNANLAEVDFMDAVLASANLGNADLSAADLSGATLIRANLREANLSGAFLINVDLIDADLSRAVLINSTLREVNLSNANLQEAILLGANLNSANLNSANFSDASLNDADLSKTQSLATNFTGATFTGAWLEDWHINNETKLGDVICEYIYLKQNLQERRPSDPNQVFAAGEFTKLFRKAVSTVDLIFRNGVDWEALSLSLNKLKVEAEGVEFSVQSIENKDDGTFVVRINTPTEANKAEVEKYIKREYESAEKVLRAQYVHQLQLKDVEIDGYRRENTNLLRVVNVLGSRPINAIALSGSQSMGDRNIHMGSGNYNERFAGNYIQGNYINMSQDLTQAAQQIQDLLQQLQNQGVTVEDSQQQVANDIAKQAETNPTMMGKLVLWGKAMANKASETTVSEAAKIVFTLALKAAGFS